MTVCGKAAMGCIAFTSTVFNATDIGAPQGGTVESVTINGGYINVIGKGTSAGEVFFEE